MAVEDDCCLFEKLVGAELFLLLEMKKELMFLELILMMLLMLLVPLLSDIHTLDGRQLLLQHQCQYPLQD